MVESDPDDPRSPAQRVAAALRAAIKTGDYGPGDRLPSQQQLSEEHQVARETVKRALEMLTAERLIVTRRGSGSYVRVITEHPVGLRAHMESIFEDDQVTIDFAGFSGETLFGALSEPLDRVRRGRFTPSSIRVRLLVTDPTSSQPIPARVDGSDPTDVRTRMARITDRSVHSIIDAVNELGELGLVSNVSAEARTHPVPPLLKLYILNEGEVFFGYYLPGKRTVTIRGEQVDIIDALGKDTVLMPFTSDTDEGHAFVKQSQLWFDALWTTLGQPYEF